ncbi:hypothetical protein RclHR1_06950003 [Rhizophagus clarus]|uniref:Extracellular membrane protein CFEM domain-containing protein n=1 Tax=Rhizophagus clarus TaxID=94130 RepID=A0A2Z6SJU4_9GLOM|nr:hypothetical protein RclHR1_06950003 [Rhizophagus clarus]GES87348.1 hypothetical protein GLOIN_2v1771469 [Rhizophagus clarus]
MKLLLLLFIVIIFGTGALSQYNFQTCKGTLDSSCYNLNILLAPCHVQINLNEPVALLGSSVGYADLPYPKCVCNQNFYNNLQSCGSGCGIPVDSQSKFQSDCGTWGGSPSSNSPSSPSLPNGNNNYSPNSDPNIPNNSINPNTSNPSQNSGPNTGTIVGSIVSVIGAIGAAIVGYLKYKSGKKDENKDDSKSSQTQPSIVIHNNPTISPNINPNMNNTNSGPVNNNNHA